MYNSINHIVFTDVYQEFPFDDRIDIHFTVDTQSYFLEMYKTQDAYRPSSVWHYEGQLCSFCHKRSAKQCEPLRSQLNELYQALIEHPSIRLEWLFLPHQKRG